MGYKSKLYVVKKCGREAYTKRYAQVIAMFDMCKMGDMNRIFETETDCYFYADDGNTEVLEDKYGCPLTEANVEDVIDVLEEAIEEGEDYRRIFPLLAALKVIHEQQKRNIWKDVVVLHYGY